MTKHSTRNVSLGYLLVILATAGWGTSGLFIKFISLEIDISALALAFWRDLTTFLCLAVSIGIIKPELLRVARRDIKWLAGLGVFSIGTFHVLWNLSVWNNGVSAATILQEAAPAFVALMAWVIWRESITKVKVLAILVTFAGCVLVARPDALSQVKISTIGIVIGLGSAITYGSFSLFGKMVSQNYSPWTVLTYGFGFGMLILFPVQFLSPGPWPVLTPARGWFIILIAFPTIVSFAMYTLSLRWLSASVAAIVATSEVVFASLFAYTFLGERLSWMQWAGALLVVGGVVAISLARSDSGSTIPLGQTLTDVEQEAIS